MVRRSRAGAWAIAPLLMGAFAAFLVGAIDEKAATITGRVLDEGGAPVSGATVRIQATESATTTAQDGSFTLRVSLSDAPVTVSAWKHLYYCAKVEGVMPPAGGLLLRLDRYQTDDNPDHAWMPPISGDPARLTCAVCKPDVTAVWLENAHAGAGTNPRFFSMYNGTDVTGSRPVPPGYVQDFPGTSGICATCHAPGAAIDAPYTTSMNRLSGANLFGVHCDVCHKTADVYLNPATALPYDNAPGVLSMDVRRPFPDREHVELFFGTFDDDNVPEEDTRLPLIEESAFCAPCHQFSFWGTPIYESYREWLESPYAKLGITCQDCHMPSPTVVDGEVLRRVATVASGGVQRDPMTIHAHTQRGASDVDFLQNTVELSVRGEPGEDGTLSVSISLRNERAGHHVPTDYPGRQMILLLTATTDDGTNVSLDEGPVLPDWCGDLAGRPGIAYAKVLRDVETGESPVVNYWKQTLIESDNRLAALETDRSVYRFGPVEGRVTIQATVLFRRLFQELAEDKGWRTPDILMEEEQITLDAPVNR